MDTEKVIAIETALAHQEKVMAELSDVIHSQWSEIEALKKQLIKANTKLADLESNLSSDDKANVKPPHW